MPTEPSYLLVPPDAVLVLLPVKELHDLEILLKRRLQLYDNDGERLSEITQQRRDRMSALYLQLSEAYKRLRRPPTPLSQEEIDG